MDPPIPVPSDQRGGAALAYIGTEARVIVSSTVGDVWVFRYHPAEANYDPFTQQASVVSNFSVGAAVHSTPLILADDRIVIQTTRDVQCWSINPSVTRLWRFPPDEPDEIVSISASPGIGYTKYDGTGLVRIFAIGGSKLYSIDPYTGVGFVLDELRSGDQGHASPAVGPMPNDSNARNVVYAPIFAGPNTSPHLYAAWASGTQGANNLVWRGDITNEFLGARPSGTLSSPFVFADGRVVMPSDDGVLYDFAAVVPANPDNPPYLFLPRPYGTQQTERPTGDQFYSTTAVLGPGGSYLLTGEDSSDLVIYAFGVAFERARRHVEVGDAWVFGAFAGDGADRVMAVTRGTCDNQHARRLHGMQLRRSAAGAWDSFDTFTSWKYPRYLDSSTCIPPITTPPCNPYIFNRTADPLYAPPAMDIDGTMICVTPRTIFAVRPLRGDFNGDGCRNNFDIDALALALTDPYWWEHTDANNPSETGFGERKGVNLLGVGDVNNDRAFNNFDLDPWIALIVADARCACTGWDDNAGGDGFAAPAANSGAGDATDDDWAHFWNVVGQLQERFGS